MDYRALERYIRRDMRMTHIYQPVMIRTLLESADGTATTEEIARQFLARDESQLNYYKRITKRWPHITLRKHNVVSYSRDRYTLLLDGDVTAAERRRLSELCGLRLDEFIDRDPWIRKFRELDARSLSGSVRYDVLSRSKGVCVGCGIAASQMADSGRMLHVDHIVPESWGGPTEPSNFQPLCSRCNQGKRNRDDLDFILWHNRLKFRKSGCPLCAGAGDRANAMAHAREPEEPLAEGHTVVAPNRHAGSFIELIPAEKQLCLALVDSVMRRLRIESAAREFRVSGMDSGGGDHCRIDVVPVR